MGQDENAISKISKLVKAKQSKAIVIPTMLTQMYPWLERHVGTR